MCYGGPNPLTLRNFQNGSTGLFKWFLCVWWWCMYIVPIFLPFFCMGGPQKCFFCPKIIISGHKWLQPPQMGWTSVKLGWTLYFTSGMVSWDLLACLEMSIGGFPGGLKCLNWPPRMWNIIFNPVWPMFNPFEGAGATYSWKWCFWGENSDFGAKKTFFGLPIQKKGKKGGTIYIQHHQTHRNHLNKPVEPFQKFLNVSGLGPQ